MLTATDRKPQKIIKKVILSRWHPGDVMVYNCARFEDASQRKWARGPQVAATHRSATHLCKRNLQGHHAFCFNSKMSAVGDVCTSKRLTYLSNSWFRWNRPDSRKCRRYTCRENSCFHVNTVLQPFKTSAFQLYFIAYYCAIFAPKRCRLLGSLHNSRCQ